MSSCGTSTVELQGQATNDILICSCCTMLHVCMTCARLPTSNEACFKRKPGHIKTPQKGGGPGVQSVSKNDKTATFELSTVRKHLQGDTLAAVYLRFARTNGFGTAYTKDSLTWRRPSDMPFRLPKQLASSTTILSNIFASLLCNELETLSRHE